jgi:hypothetical protein
MKYLFQIYPAASADEFEGLSEDEQEAIVGEYLALERGQWKDLLGRDSRVLEGGTAEGEGI